MDSTGMKDIKKLHAYPGLVLQARGENKHPPKKQMKA